MSVTYADPAAGLSYYLIETVGSLVDPIPAGQPNAGNPAIFRPSLPQWVDKNMPLKALVVRPQGGYQMFAGATLPVGDPILDIICYAAVDQDASYLATNVYQALKRLWTYNQAEWGGVKLYWAIPTGPIPLPDQDTLWHAVWVGAQVMVADVANTN